MPVVVNAMVAEVAVVEPPGAEVIVTVGAPGGGGTIDHAAEAMPAPPAFDARTSSVWAPSASAFSASGVEHAAYAPPSTRHSVVSTVPVVVQEKTAEVASVDAAGCCVSTTDGAVGAASTAKARLATFQPPALPAVTAKTCGPTASAETDRGELQAVQAAPSSEHRTLAADPVTVNGNDADVA